MTIQDSRRYSGVDEKVTEKVGAVLNVIPRTDKGASYHSSDPYLSCCVIYPSQLKCICTGYHSFE
jgi:hypothetical protein